MDTASHTENGRAKLKPNRLRSVSAAKEFQNLILERKDRLKIELPPEHFALIAILEHKQPMDMAHIIAEKFDELYPGEPNIRLRVLVHLHPEFYKKQPISFHFLQHQLATLEYEFSGDKPFWGFIDSLRLIFTVLPKPKRYDIDKRVKKQGEDVTFSAQQMMMQEFQCIHCWRMVYRYPSQNGKVLCETHDMPCTCAAYQRKKRLREKADLYAIKLFDILGEILKRMTIVHKSYCAHKFAVLACFLLPNTNDYLLSQFAVSGAYSEEEFKQAAIELVSLPKESPFWQMPPELHNAYMQANEAPGAVLIRAIVDALDPPPLRLHTQLAKARELFVQRLTWDFGEYLYHLCRAEAWLAVEKNVKHGGKRDRAGRKRSGECPHTFRV